MKKLALIIALFTTSKFCQAQLYSLNNSGTLYDSFENPVQITSTKDLSRKYAFNMFFPAIGNSVYFDGEANNAFKTMLFKQKINASGIGNIGEARMNNLYTNSNNYLLMFKIYKSVKYKRELGFAFQVRNESNLNATNETFAILDNYGIFPNDNYTNVLNGNGYSHSYSQLSVTYRENYDKNWAFGGKLSILNGIAYVKGDVSQTSLNIDRVNNIITEGIVGTGFSSFGVDAPNKSILFPNFRNPGLSINLGASYTSPNGLYLTGNVKDLGFIRWNSSSSKFNFNDVVKVYKANANNLAERFYDKFNIMLAHNQTNGGLTTATNGKIEFLASKTFAFYKPNFIVSKNIFESEGALALINNFNYDIWNVSLNGIYDLRQGFNFGSQFMIKAPNVEFYIGSENLFPSTRFLSGYLKSDPTVGSNPTQADFYMGFSLKFGKMMQNFSNAGDQGKGVRNLNAKGIFDFLKRKDKSIRNNDTRRD
jgi:hypothetical protein